MWETQLWSPGREDSPGEGNGNHSSILAREISWTEESGRLQFMGWQRVGHNWMTSLCLLEWELTESLAPCACHHDSSHLQGFLSLHNWVLKPKGPPVCLGRDGNVAWVLMWLCRVAWVRTPTALGCDPLATLQISQWEPTTTAALPLGVGRDHSDKSDWSNSKVLLTQNFTRKKAFWGPFPNSSFKPPFFSGNLS